MTLWIAMAALTAVVLAFLLRPLLRPAVTEGAASTAPTIYRDQLAELEREANEGLIGKAEAEAARRAVARRLLAAAEPGRPTRTAPPRRVLAILLLLLLPGAALSLYLWLGQPDLPARPLAGRGEELARAHALGEELQSAADAVQANPHDAAAWRRLGLALVLAGESQAAIQAIQTALTLGASFGPGWESETWALLAGAIIERRGEVPPMARQALARALELDPGNLLALYLTGVVLRQDGALEQALDLWLMVAEAGGRDLPFGAALDAAIRDALERLGRPLPPG